MKLRYRLLGIVVIYLICNALFSDSSSTFVANLVGHAFVTGVALFVYFIAADIIIPDDMEKLSRWTTQQVSMVKTRISVWWDKPRPVLDALVDLLTKPVARKRLIREANTGQYELPLDE